eukprot:TRINITY_DN1456_c0_g1_i1.p1 TRINITY_DN1456_c0_g1~~TRINITY_DN1456_c0_g1_i1.p1  ORF type:complete len:398 (-),score=110.86 TRINITY_DN1456_c0_g1_i1:25-1218(-)
MRQGPCVAKVAPFGAATEGLKVAADGLVVENTSTETRFVKCNVLAKTGKWYFEVTINASISGSVCVGWALPTLDSGHLKTNLGDDSLSWAYDIYRQRKCHSSDSTSSWYGDYFSNGDTLGCKVDLEQKKISFSKNGNELGVAFEAGDLNPTDGLFPAASIFRKAKLTFNFDKKKWKHPPKNDPDVQGLHAQVTEQEYASLVEIFNRFKNEGVNLSESGETGDVIKGQGFLNYGKEMGVEEDTDIGLMILAWKLNAEGQWEFKREEFVDGWVGYGCSSLAQMKKRLDVWRQELKDKREEFKKFYFFVFDYLKEDKRTIILTEEALTVWQMLGLDKSWPLWDKWAKYIVKEVKAVSRDNWRQYIDFIKAHPEGVDNYDPNASWPVLMDGFVDYINENQD